ncbi:MAG: hypothetical protein JRD89_16310 [Deltaproteobacteria bacterium]|nr:hypothetical protein [Deltaproteobacteria bacterium]
MERAKLIEELKEELVRQLRVPWPVISVILGPEQLNDVMLANSPKLVPSLMRIPTFRLTFLVPAEEEVEIVLSIPEDFVCTKRRPLKFSSDYYDVDLLVDVSVDGWKVNPYPMPLTGEFDVDFGAYYVKFHDVTIRIYNNTSVDVHVTVQCMGHFIHRRQLYERWYKPITELVYDMLGRLAEVRMIRELERGVRA